MKKLAALLLLVLLMGFLYCGETDFADSLMAHGEYYRAITEYYRLLYGGDPVLAGTGHQGIREAYLRGQDWDGMLDYLSYQRTKDDFAFRAWAWINKDRPDLAAIACADDPDPARIRMYSISRAFQGKYQEALDALEEADYTPQDLDMKLRDIIATADALPRKIPALAGIISVVPGAGYAYNGHWGTAFASFAANLLWVAVVVELLDRDLNYSAAGVASVGLGFYFGNIWGSANQAKKINANRRYAYLYEHLGPIIGEEFLHPDD